MDEIRHFALQTINRIINRDWQYFDENQISAAKQTCYKFITEGTKVKHLNGNMKGRFGGEDLHQGENCGDRLLRGDQRVAFEVAELFQGPHEHFQHFGWDFSYNRPMSKGEGVGVGVENLAESA
jgi:hypothetical protein